MGRNICFRPDRDFVDRLENYMAVHHIEDKSEAMRKICEEWATQKRNLEVYKDLVNKKFPKTPDTATVKTCPLGQKFNNKQEQEYFCSMCKTKTPVEYNRCQASQGG